MNVSCGRARCVRVAFKAMNPFIPPFRLELPILDRIGIYGTVSRMFGNKGKKNFERCEHKEVTFQRTGNAQRRLILRAVLDCPRTEEANLDIDVRADNDVDQYGREGPGVQTWPLRGGGTIRAYNSPADAQDHLGRAAGRMACGNCPYPKMSRLEVSKARAERAEELRDVAVYDKRRLEAEVVRREALGEVEELTRKLELPPLDDTT